MLLLDEGGGSPADLQLQIPVIEQFMEALTALRKQRGHVISLRELRYADAPRLHALEAEAAKLKQVELATLVFPRNHVGNLAAVRSAG